jgi:hypothetical protein
VAIDKTPSRFLNTRAIAGVKPNVIVADQLAVSITVPFRLSQATTNEWRTAPMYELFNRVAIRLAWPKKPSGAWVDPYPRNQRILDHYQRSYDRGYMTLNTACSKACSDIMGNNGHPSLPQRWEG